MKIRQSSTNEFINPERVVAVLPLTTAIVDSMMFLNSLALTREEAALLSKEAGSKQNSSIAGFPNFVEAFGKLKFEAKVQQAKSSWLPLLMNPAWTTVGLAFPLGNMKAQLADICHSQLPAVVVVSPISAGYWLGIWRT